MLVDIEELLGASATDPTAVLQYLGAIEDDELDELLERWFAAESAGPGDDAHERRWLALVTLLLRSDAARRRTTLRLLRVVCQQHQLHGTAAGRPVTGVAATHWLTEIGLAYAAAAAALNANCDKSNDRHRLAAELAEVLDMLLAALGDILSTAGRPATAKLLVPLLALVPIVLRIEADLAAASRAPDDGDEDPDNTNEHARRLLELPWTIATIPSLLELLREHAATLLPPSSGARWRPLREQIRRLITDEGREAEALNPLLRECLLVAAAAGTAEADADAPQWIHLARDLLRRLPAHARREAEFTLHMCLHQYPGLVDLVVEALDARPPANDDEPDDTGASLDWRDLVLLLHAVRASKPLLHHHLTTTTTTTWSGTKDRAFVLALASTLALLRPRASASSASSAAAPAGGSHEAEGKHIRAVVSQVLAFGGAQVHNRQWKALILLEMPRHWAGTAEDEAVAYEMQLAIFAEAPEVRGELLRGLIDAIRQSSSSDPTPPLTELSAVLREHTALVRSHVPILEDWLSSVVVDASAIAVRCFSIVAPLVQASKDFFNFAMVLLRKLLCSPSSAPALLAVEIWCRWLGQGLRLDALQEEEVVLAIKNALVLFPSIQAPAFRCIGRLLDERRAAATTTASSEPISPTTLRTIEGLLHQRLEDFVRLPSRGASSTATHEDDDAGLSDDDPDDDDDPSAGGRRFGLGEFLMQFHQDKSLHGALQVGELLGSLLACLRKLEDATSDLANPWTRHTRSRPRYGALVRWMERFVLEDMEGFFAWVSVGPNANAPAIPGPTPSPMSPADERLVWVVAARVSAGVALCRVVHERHLASPTIWRLVELELCLLRFWRGFAASVGTKALAGGDGTARADRLEASVAQAARRSAGTLLAAVARGVLQPGATEAGAVPSGGPSLDAVLFLLEAMATQAPGDDDDDDDSSSSSSSTSDTALRDVRVLVDFYQGVVGQFLGAASRTTAIAFTVYAEAMASKFPPSVRHLVAVDRHPTSTTIALDDRATEELVSRIATALGKLVDRRSKNRPCLEETLVRAIAGGLLAPRRPPPTAADGASPHAMIARRLLRDLQQLMRHDGLPKAKMAVAALAKRFVDRSVNAKSEASDAASDELAATCELAYEILCEHAVPQLPLLRALLGICFSPRLGGVRRPTVLLKRLEVTLDACGFETDPRKRRLTIPRERDKQVGGDKGPKEAPESTTTRVPSRKRLRRPAPLFLPRDQEEEEDDVTEDEDAVVVARPPLLLSSAAQAAAIQGALWLADAFLSRALEGARFDLFLEVNALMMGSVLATTDVTWATTRVLVRLLAMFDKTLRIGKASAQAPTPVGPRVFEASVRFALQTRTWLLLLRHGASDAGTKSKIATAMLKIDVFLLEIPATVETLLSDPARSTTQKAALRAFVRSVEMDLAPLTTLDSSALDPPPRRSKNHLLGTVPAVKKRRRRRLRSRHPFIDACLREEDGDDAFVDLEDFIA